MHNDDIDILCKDWTQADDISPSYSCPIEVWDDDGKLIK